MSRCTASLISSPWVTVFSGAEMVARAITLSPSFQSLAPLTDGSSDARTVVASTTESITARKKRMGPPGLLFGHPNPPDRVIVGGPHRELSGIDRRGRSRWNDAVDAPFL